MNRRPYRSTLRDEHARHTRQRLVDAAIELFVTHGYAAATIEAIAERADVSRRTVFSAVGGKSALLKLAFIVGVAADHDPDAAALLGDTDRQRADGNRALVERLDELDALRTGLDLGHAAAIADVMIDPCRY